MIKLKDGGKDGSGCCHPCGLSRGLVCSFWGVLVVSLSVIFQKFVSRTSLSVSSLHWGGKEQGGEGDDDVNKLHCDFGIGSQGVMSANQNRKVS